MDSEDIPAGVVVDRSLCTLRIDWSAGDPTVIPWKLLRLSCPCAQCQGEFHTESLDEAAILRAEAETDMVDITMMGHYAVQPEWRSGHATGIFTWEYLKKIARQSG